MASDPHNVVRLILPQPAPGHPGDVYVEAARALREWQDERILVPDPRRPCTSTSRRRRVSRVRRRSPSAG